VEPTHGTSLKHLKDRLWVLPTNIRLGWKCLTFRITTTGTAIANAITANAPALSVAVLVAVSA
jgi:hypothetical protein